MANFTSGFVQGFQPFTQYLMKSVLDKKEDQREKDSKLYDDLAKKQQEKLVQQQDELYYNLYTQDPIKNGMVLGKMSPGMRIAADDWISKQDKVKYDERTDETGRHLVQQRFDWRGNLLEEKVRETIPVEVRKETIENEGITQTWKIMSDGSRVLGDKKVDYTKRKKDIENERKKEDNEILSFRKEVEEASKSFSKAGIFKDKADVIAANSKEPKNPDYTQSRLNKLDYDNRKTILKFKARQTMSPTAFEALDQIDQWNDPTVYKDEVKQLIMDLRKEGASQTDVSKIAQWYLLKTGKELE